MKNNESIPPSVVFSLIAAVALLTLFVIGLTGAIKTEDMYNDFNNGVCRICGGAFVYEKTVSYSNSNFHYIYKCDRCAREFISNEFFPPSD